MKRSVKTCLLIGIALPLVSLSATMFKMFDGFRSIGTSPRVTPVTAAVTTTKTADSLIFTGWATGIGSLMIIVALILHFSRKRTT